MKAFASAFLVLVLALAAPALAGDTYVKGYYRKDGTYVQPHYRSAPNNNRFNNYSTRGNTNPYTGEKGYVDPYKDNYGNSYDSGRRKNNDW